MAGRYSRRKHDAELGRVDRRLREMSNAIADVSEGSLQTVEGSNVSITQILTDPTSVTEYIDTDLTTAAVDDATVTLTLTWTPIAGSLWMSQNGVRLQADEFTRLGTTVTIPASSDVIIRTGDEFAAWYVRDTTAALPVDPTYIEAVQALGPIWFGVQDETTGLVLVDYSGYSRDGTYNNGVTLGANQIVPNLVGTRTCADYDGSNDYGSSPYGSWLNINGIAIVAWVQLDAVGGSNVAIVSRNNLAGVDPFLLYVTTGSKPAFVVGTSGGGTPYTVTGATTLVAGTTYMISAIYNSATGSLDVFVNGSLDGHLAASGNLKTSLVYPATLGIAGAAGTFLFALNGRIGPVALFDPASGFDATDISSLYTAGSTL